MSKGVNKVILIGNLGQDPDVKYMPSGVAIANITVATSESWKDKNTGETVDKTEWHRVVFFKRLAEIVGEYLHKGSKIYIEGRLQTRKWQKDGQDHWTTEIIANEMQMLDSRANAEAIHNSHSQTTGQQRASAAQSHAGGDGSPNPNDFDDDIPF